MIGIYNYITRVLICLFLFYFNPNCRVLCDGAKEFKKSTIKFCDVPTLLPHTNIIYQCTKYIKNESKSCVFNGTVFESTAIKISCDDGYSTDAMVSFCNGNEWIPPIKGCIKQCKKLDPVNIHLECLRENVSIPCDEKYLVSGVTVRPTCEHLNSSGFQLYPGHQEIHCQEDGKWDNDLLSCVHDCGRLRKTLSDSETPNMPWNVIIYQHEGKAVCFGTIISPRVIITTAYCVSNIIYGYKDYKSLSRPLDHTVFNVGLFRDSAPHSEKNSSRWFRLNYLAYKLGLLNKQQRFTSLKIKEFRYFKHGNQDKSIFHDVLIVIMEKEINFNSHVFPACVQWEHPNRLNITTGIAKVQQYNDSAERYSYEDYSFWSHDGCQNNWACLMYDFDYANRYCNDTKHFRKSNTVLHDGKLFCIEQKLDELNHPLIVHGSGIMVEKEHRYFIRGIAGEVFLETELLNSEKRLVGVTDIADYVDWIKHIVAEVDPYYNPST